MGYPYYGRTDIEGRRFEDDRERWEDRDYDRPQREGTRFDENRWRGRERAQGYTQGSYGYGERERGWGRDDERDLRHERYYPGRYGRYGEGYRPMQHEDERYYRAREMREHDDDRSMLERFGDRVREGLRRIGRGPKGFKRSDERIAEEVCERIARSPINAENVEVKVKDGEVTLTGFVDARYDKRNLEDMADDVFGVTEVHNQLRVQPQTTQQRGTSTTTQASQSTPQGRITHS